MLTFRNEYILKLIISTYKFCERVDVQFKVPNKHIEKICLNKTSSFTMTIKSYAEKPPQQNVSINGILLLADGFLAIGGETLTIWDNNFNFVKIIKQHQSLVSKLGLLHNGQLFSADESGKLFIWDTKNKFSLLRELSGHTDKISNVKLFSNGDIISASDDGIVNIWGCSANYKCIDTLEGENMINLSVVLILQDLYIITYSNTRFYFYIWAKGGMNKYECINIAQATYEIYHQDILSIGERTILFINENNIQKWTFDKEFTSYTINESLNYDAELWEVRLMGNDKIAVSAGNGFIYIKDINNIAEDLQVLKAPKDLYVFSNKLITVGSDTGIIKIWATYNNKYRCIKTIKINGNINSVKIKESENIIIGSGKRIINWKEIPTS
jgi:WD40 repeat protein